MVDSYPGLNRDDLLKKINDDLVSQFDLQPEQVHLTGAMVLYNNMLQSLSIRRSRPWAMCSRRS